CTTSAPRWSISASISDCSSSGGTSPRNTLTNRPMNSPPASAPSSPASKASASISGLLSEASQIIAELQRRKRRTRLLDYRPYARQREFHAAGLLHRERL